jgi:mono/diheme cytochrome c family protein
MRKILIILVLTAILGCDRTRNQPGWDYFPDMFYSTAYETYTVNPNFADGKTMRTPVEGTIPRGYIPFEYNTTPESRIKAGSELVNPFKPDPANIERGKIIYDIYCNICHGPAGSGDGYLFQSGLYPMKPRPIAGPTAAPLKDGEIYHTITLGFVSMGPYGTLVMPDDRWKVVLYVRQLQQENR